MNDQVLSYWVTQARHGVTVSGPPSRDSSGHRPLFPCENRFILSGASAPLQRQLIISLPAKRAPPMGFRPSSQHQQRVSTRREVPRLATFRPRRFSRPRRLTPPTALRVYFTPQPRTGFTLQGFSLSHSLEGSHQPEPSCRSNRIPATGKPAAPGPGTRLQGIALCKSP
jgi:hypothetical protein